MLILTDRHSWDSQLTMGGFLGESLPLTGWFRHSWSVGGKHHTGKTS